MQVHQTLSDAFTEFVSCFGSEDHKQAIRHVNTGDFLLPIWKKSGGEVNWRWLHIRARKPDEPDSEFGLVIVDYVAQPKLESTAWVCIPADAEVSELRAPLVADCRDWQISVAPPAGALPSFPGQAPVPPAEEASPEPVVGEPVRDDSPISEGTTG